MEQLRSAPPDDRTPLALAAGLVAALVGGLVWAGIVLFTDYEIGWVAWGIGLLVGVAMARTTRARSPSLAVAAGALALVGLIAGKGFVVVGSTGSVADELLATPEYMAGAMAWDMYSAGELEVETMDAIRATQEAGDTLSDAVWEEMLAQADARLAIMTPGDRQAFADGVAAGMVNQMGLVGGIRSQLSGFDLLWLFLAVGTAFQMMNGKQEEAVEPVVADSQGSGPLP